MSGRIIARQFVARRKQQKPPNKPVEESRPTITALAIIEKPKVGTFWPLWKPVPDELERDSEGRLRHTGCVIS